ncbi:MAG: serine/threonine-protein kinase [Acidobacteriota bacterium]
MTARETGGAPPERWTEVKTVLGELLALSETDRRDRLLELEASDAALHAEVASLIGFADHLGEGGFLEPIARDAADSRIGSYRIDGVLGSGGMGTVFEAVRTDDFEKRVALKVIRRGHGDRASVRRFERERQILAELEHPSIARLLDGGSTSDGLPYLVMERVDGVAIDRYAATHALDARARVALVEQVCAAVHFAHQRQIVHRDLKPANILVTDEGVPKLLDFGIAQLVRGEVEPGGASALTPAYASPEQLRGERATTASDVYSLGVLLWRLLTGEVPVRDDQGLVSGRPSQADTESEAPVPRRVLRGDLDAIVCRALAPEPEARYDSARQLAEDLRRYREGRPVAARQGSSLYQLGRFMGRHRVGTVVAVLMLLLGLGLAVFAGRWWQADLEREQEKAVADFFEDLFTTSQLLDEPEGEVTARRVLGRIRARAPDRPDLQAILTLATGRIFQKRGHFDVARPLAEESLVLRRSIYRPGDLRIARGANVLAVILNDIGETQVAEELFREAFEIRMAAGGMRDSETLHTINNLAAILAARGELAEAESLHRRGLELRSELYGERSSEVATALNSLGTLLFQRDQLDEAARLLNRALAIRSVLGDKAAAASSYNNLARVEAAAGDLDSAERLYRLALTEHVELYGEEHPNVAIVRRNLGEVRARVGDARECKALLRASIVVLHDVLPAHHWRLADARSVLGGCFAANGELEEARRYLEYGVTHLRTAKGDEARVTQEAVARLEALETLEEATATGEQAIEYQVAASPPDRQ